MVTITVCVGSSCYVRGSEKLAETFSRLAHERGMEAQVALMGAFCMDQCSMGVSVRVGDRAYHGVNADEGLSFFEDEVVPYLQSASGSKDS